MNSSKVFQAVSPSLRNSLVKVSLLLRTVCSGLLAQPDSKLLLRITKHYGPSLWTEETGLIHGSQCLCPPYDVTLLARCYSVSHDGPFIGCLSADVLIFGSRVKRLISPAKLCLIFPLD